MYHPNFPPVPFHLGLYPIVDSVVWVKRLLNIGVRTIQLRMKDKCDKDIETEVATAILLGQQYHARLFINDYWRLAVKYSAWGLHLGQEDIKTADLSAIRKAGIRLGISTHNREEINTALSIRPSYIALGHIFPTKTKKMKSSPQGLERLIEYTASLTNYPTVAIGGIDIEHASAVVATGTGSVAVISAITRAQNWRKAAVRLIDIVGVGDE